MRLLVTLSTLMLLFLPGCDALDSITGPDDTGTTLTGHVTSTSIGRGYYPATVALVDGSPDFRYEGVNTEGRYRFRNLRPGRYIVVLTLGQGAGVREALREPIEIVEGANVKDFAVP